MAFSFDQNKEWRVGTCFSLVTASLPDLKSECVEPENGTEPLLMLWGNSHAAQLYPGLKSLQRKAKFRIAQFTFGSCPPIPGWNVRTEPFCEAANDRVLAWARQATPHVAVLASTWDYRDIRGIADYQNLSSVVQALESAGVKRVIVVGPAPRWPETLRELVIKRVLKDPDSKFSERIDTTFENLPIDAAMKRLSLNSGYRYVSAFDVFCDGRGCLASIDGKPDGLTSLDTHHLTPKASELLAPAILREAFQ